MLANVLFAISRSVGEGRGGLLANVVIAALEKLNEIEIEKIKALQIMRDG